MGTFSRLRYVIAANVNALIEKAEDPEKLLRALIREMEDAREEARLASAEMLAEQLHLDRLAAQLAGEAELWQSRAEKAVEENRDDLARAALTARAEIMDRHRAAQQELDCIGQRIGQMESDMATLKNKLSDAKLKLKNICVRSYAGKTVNAGAKTVLSASEKRVQRAMGRFEGLQMQVENLEARVRSYDLGGPEPATWNSPAAAQDPQVEQELTRLKQRMGRTEERNLPEASA